MECNLNVSPETYSTLKEYRQMARGTSNSKRNTSGRGPVGIAPASRAPVKAAKVPTTPNRNPNAQGGPINTGGGPGSNKHIKVKPVGGSPQTRKTTPGTTADFGKMIGNHASDSPGGTVTRHDPPLHQPMPTLGGRLGNDLNYEQGRTGDVGPGRGGRVVHAKGSQAHYDNPANHPGTINADRSISPPGSNQGSPVPTRPMSPPDGGGPGSMGFKPGGK